MCEPIITTPWTCGFEDGCEVGWHLSQYWIGHDGYTYDPYSDGDHEAVEEEDLRSADEIQNVWLHYSQYVADTGLDPLGEFFVKRTITRKARYQARIGKAVGGVRLLAIRKGRKQWLSQELSRLSDEVRMFLGIEDSPSDSRPIMQDFDAFIRAISGEHSNVRIMHRSSICPTLCDVQIEFELDERIPRSKRAVTRELKALARKAVRMRETEKSLR